MKIEVRTEQPHPTLVLRGDFETDAADGFLAAVDQLRTGGDPSVMVSLRYVKYLNSTALGAIVRARSACTESGGDLVIVEPSSLSREIITKMGLNGVLRIFEDQRVAANYLSGMSPVEDDANPNRDAGAANEDQVAVMFTFSDDRTKQIPGKSRRGTAILERVDSAGLVFHWDPAKYDSDAATAASLFVKGSTMRNKLQIKILRKEFFEAESTIEDMVLDESGTATVSARWLKIAAADREALGRYQDDMDFLRKQASGPSVD